MIKDCLYCGKTFKFKGTKRKYCCCKCNSMSSRGHKDSEETKRKRSQSLMGHKFSKESILKMSQTRKGRPTWNKGKKCPSLSGENHWNWRGGVTANKQARIKNSEWINLSREVKKRDNYTCFNCGKKFKSSDLDCHHIIPYRINKNNNIANLKIFCKSCHTKEDILFRWKEERDPIYQLPYLRKWIPFYK